jgi:hypothetical protein
MTDMYSFGIKIRVLYLCPIIGNAPVCFGDLNSSRSTMSNCVCRPARDRNSVATQRSWEHGIYVLPEHHADFPPTPGIVCTAAARTTQETEGSGVARTRSEARQISQELNARYCCYGEGRDRSRGDGNVQLSRKIRQYSTRPAQAPVASRKGRRHTQTLRL